MLHNKLEEYLSEEIIKERVESLGSEISRKYDDKSPIFIGILNGSFIFFADLVRSININLEVRFLTISSYKGISSTGKIKFHDQNLDKIKNQDLIVVEDIVDTGNTIKALKRMLLKQKPKSIAFVALLMKKNMAKINFNIDWVGFEIPDEFVVGYGLDFNQKYRNLKGIYKYRGI